MSHLGKIVNKSHAADLSVLFRSLSLTEQHKLFDMLDDVEQKGILFSELDSDTLQDLIEDMRIEDIVQILENMPADDVADIIGRLPEEKSKAILEKMKRTELEEVEGLLRYDDDTAGGIMVPDFIALREDITARQAVESLQKEHSDVEMPFYLYVVDEYGKLVGSLVPMGFARVNIDPAVATGPFVTTAIDILSVSFYFLIATSLLGI